MNQTAKQPPHKGAGQRDARSEGDAMPQVRQYGESRQGQQPEDPKEPEDRGPAPLNRRPEVNDPPSHRQPGEIRDPGRNHRQQTSRPSEGSGPKGR